MEFEINFLVQNRTTAWLESLKKYWLLISLPVLGGVIILFIVLYAQVINKKTSQVITTGKEFVQILQEKRKVSDLNTFLYQYQRERIVWNEILGVLSEATPGRIFLTSLEFSPGKKSGFGGSGKKEKVKLILKGVVIPVAGEDASSSIQGFMKALKKNSSFMSGFEDPVLVSVSNMVKQGQGEELDFEFHLFHKIEG